jgi:hypothetical protein
MTVPRPLVGRGTRGPTLTTPRPPEPADNLAWSGRLARALTSGRERADCVVDGFEDPTADRVPDARSQPAG